MTKLFGGAIALMLLGIYLHLMGTAILVARCAAKIGCLGTPPVFNAEMNQALAVIGGLVSALIISQLAIHKSSDSLIARFAGESASSLLKRSVQVVAVLYVVSWIAAGFAGFITSLYHPNALPVLTTMSQAWLGLAVSAAYAYFGLKQPARPEK